jgi:hypothetical protein
MSDRVAVFNKGRIEQIAARKSSTPARPPPLWRTLSAPPMCSMLPGLPA